MNDRRKHPIFSFFPIRLVIDQIRVNIALLGLWAVLLAMIFGAVGQVYGIHYLFLDPEYLHRVSFFSFWWVGLAMGLFIMAFQITSYILIGHRYTFIALLDRPFTSFVINNSVFPALFLLIYSVKLIWFHWLNPTIEKWEILIFLVGLFLGGVTMIMIVMFYLRMTNRDVFRFLALAVDGKLRKGILSRERIMQRYRESISKDHEVDCYVTSRLKVAQTTNLISFPDRNSLLRVFDQNHFNSVVFGVALIFLLMLMGALVEKPIAQIPASASVMILFAAVTMLIGAITYWFRGWGIPIILLVLIVFNLSSRSGFFASQHAAVGMNYEVEPEYYSEDIIQSISVPENYDQDKARLIESLSNWKSHYPDSIKPKLILLTVSGGGQRAALWTVATLQAINREIEGHILDHVYSITGASGGMIGATYFRETYLRTKLSGFEVTPTAVRDNIGKDNLNALIFSLISNDIFFTFKKYLYRDKKYDWDRGILFEQNLNANLGGALNNNLSYYEDLEKKAIIPMIIFSPVISNDGRKLYLSSSPINYMTQVTPVDGETKVLQGVDYNRLFKKQQSDSLSLLSALRMSASFPYITPSISLPSDPVLEIMDAGVADNFGVGDALHLSYVAKDWINQNTSGVVLLTIRDTQKITPVEPKSNPSLIHRFTYPISSVYNNLSNIQDVRNDRLIAYANSWLEVPLHPISFEYDTYSFSDIQERTLTEQNRLSSTEVARASLSWHLTEQEKINIIKNLGSPLNQAALKKLISVHQE